MDKKTTNHDIFDNNFINISRQELCLTDYRYFYQLECYLEQVVKARFDKHRELDAFDFFCIIIWKANRAKSRIAKRLMTIGESDNLDKPARELTRMIAAKLTDRSKLELLIKEWKFLLPMASAILSVLYPKYFTVYDERVCRVLGRDFHLLKNKTSMESIWTGYMSFIKEVRRTAPSRLSLRDQDRWLWGKSFYKQHADNI